MCIPLTPVLLFITTVIIKVYLQCFIESVSLRDVGKATSRAEISSPNSLYLNAVKGALSGSVLTGATSELKKSNHKKNSPKTQLPLLKRKLRASLYIFYLHIYSIKFRKKETLSQQNKKIKNRYY